MKHSSKLTVFSNILTPLLALTNVSHLLWTCWLIAEQVRTGWGFGTNMELAVLYPWLTELLCTPVLLASLVYFILSCFYKPNRTALIINICLFAATIVQFTLTNLFIFF